MAQSPCRCLSVWLLLATIAFTAQGFTDVAKRGVDRWDPNGGEWDCPASIGWDFKCSNGKVFCTCPGNLEDTTSTYYWIGCTWDETWSTHWCGQPKVGRDWKDCSIYHNCNQCRTNIHYDDDHVCENCLPGWKGPKCEEDEDECAVGTSGCAHECQNTIGSFYCTCPDGHLLYDQTLCKRVDCPPIESNGVKVTYSGDALASTYAMFECEDPSQVISGPSVSLCQMIGGVGKWDVNEPRCVDVPPTTSPLIRISGRLPVSSELGEKREGHSFGSCQNICIRNPNECKAYAAETRIDKGVTIHDCYLVRTPYKELYLQNKLDYVDNAFIFALLVVDSPDPSVRNDDYKGLRWKMIDRDIGCYEPGLLGDWLSYEYPELTKAKALDGYDWEWVKMRQLAIDCNSLCLRMGFDYFGIKEVLPNCHCGNYPPDTRDKYGGRSCGERATLYKTQDEYNGKCYKDVRGDVAELTMRYWGVEANKSKQECLDTCRDEGFTYAGVQNGGDCYCGYHYDETGQDTTWNSCDVPCANNPKENCGGKDGVKEVYTVYPALPFLDYQSYKFVRLDATKLYDPDNMVTGITTGIFSTLIGIHQIVTTRLVLYSSEPIRAVSGDPSMIYRDCGEIRNPKALVETASGGVEYIFRFFLFRLSQLGQYITTEDAPIRIYAQTLIIDADIDLKYSLLVRATQILYNPSRSFTIAVNKDAKDLDLDINVVKHEGPEPDYQFIQESFMCVRMLRETKTNENVKRAWFIMYEMLNIKSDKQELKSLLNLVQNYKIKFRGVEATDTHILSDYTSEHLRGLMQTYADTIQIYKDDLDKLELMEEFDDQFANLAENMNGIYINTSIAEAKSNYEDALLEYQYTEGVYRHMYIKYKTARETLQAAQANFERDIKAKQVQNAFNAILGFLGGVADVVAGIISMDVGQAVNGVIGAYNSIQSLDLNLYKLSDLVKSIDRFINISDDNYNAMKDQSTPYDAGKYKVEIEKTATLATSVVEWENLKGDADKILAVPDLAWAADTTGGDYGKAIYDLSNWGQSLATTMIEKAEKTREAVAWRVTWDIRLQQQKRAAEIVESMKNSENKNKRTKVMAIMKEQAYAITSDLNEVLISFCQAYFFDTLEECRRNFRPKLGGSLSDVLRRISTAQRESLLALPPSLASSTTIDVQVTDEDTNPNCTDLKICPVNYFRNNKEVYYTVSTDDPNLKGLHQYRVSEIIMEMEGVKANGSQPFLSLRVSASGQFKGAAFGRTFNFLGRSIALEYEYDIQLGIRDPYGIRKHADIYERFRGMVPHMTPYTTWFIKVNEERSRDVDLSGVTSIRMYFKGSTTTKSTRRRFLEVLAQRAFPSDV